MLLMHTSIVIQLRVENQIQVSGPHVAAQSVELITSLTSSLALSIAMLPQLIWGLLVSQHFEVKLLEA